MPRNVLPQRRYSETFNLSFASEKYQVTVGFYDNGAPGEVFINRIRDKAAAKLGEQLECVCRDSAILLSLALQHGVSVETIKHAITRNGAGEPSTIVGAIIDCLEDQR